MNKRIVFVSVMFLVLLAGMLTSVGCNTWKGAGKDVENTGDAMQGD